eukprot:4717588-Pyramimonas_sp.AAC.1
MVGGVPQVVRLAQEMAAQMVEGQVRQRVADVVDHVIDVLRPDDEAGTYGDTYSEPRRVTYNAESKLSTEASIVRKLLRCRFPPHTSTAASLCRSWVERTL